MGTNMGSKTAETGLLGLGGGAAVLGLGLHALSTGAVGGALGQGLIGGLGIAGSGLAIAGLTVSMPVVIGVTGLAVVAVEGFMSLSNKTVKDPDDIMAKIRLENTNGERPLLIDTGTSDDEMKTYYIYTLPLGIGTADIEKQLDRLAVAFNVDKLDYEIRKNVLVFTAHNVIPELDKKYNFEIVRPQSTMELVLGRTLTDYARIDLLKEPHLYLAGETGSGKSTATHAMLCNYISSYSPGSHQLWIADLKGGIEMHRYQRAPHCKRFVTTKEETEEMLKELFTECERRNQLMVDADVVNLAEYNEANPDSKLPRVLVLIEEASIIASDDKDNKNTTKLLTDLLALSRSAGIHFFLTLQRPCAKTLSTRVKANISTHVGLKTMNAANSKIIIDGYEGLKELRGNGHGMLEHGGKLEEFQGFWINSNQVKKHLDSLFKASQKPEGKYDKYKAVTPVKEVVKIEPVRDDGIIADDLIDDL